MTSKRYKLYQRQIRNRNRGFSVEKLVIEHLGILDIKVNQAPYHDCYDLESDGMRIEVKSSTSGKFTFDEQKHKRFGKLEDKVGLYIFVDMMTGDKGWLWYREVNNMLPIRKEGRRAMTLRIKRLKKVWKDIEELKEVEIKRH